MFLLVSADSMPMKYPSKEASLIQPSKRCEQESSLVGKWENSLSADPNVTIPFESN
jgi:hypothetical protein